MAASRDDFVIAIRSAFLKKGNKQRFSLIVLFFATSCSDTWDSVKRGLTGQKKNSTDEFLVEKKDPLVLPPNFDELPEPIDSTKENSVVDTENEDDLQQIIDMAEDDYNEQINEGGSLENSILEEINKN